MGFSGAVLTSKAARGLHLCTWQRQTVFMVGGISFVADVVIVFTLRQCKACGFMVQVHHEARDFILAPISVFYSICLPLGVFGRGSSKVEESAQVEFGFSPAHPPLWRLL